MAIIIYKCQKQLKESDILKVINFKKVHAIKI